MLTIFGILVFVLSLCCWRASLYNISYNYSLIHNMEQMTEDLEVRARLNNEFIKGDEMLNQSIKLCCWKLLDYAKLSIILIHRVDFGKAHTTRWNWS